MILYNTMVHVDPIIYSKVCQSHPTFNIELLQKFIACKYARGVMCLQPHKACQSYSFTFYIHTCVSPLFCELLLNQILFYPQGQLLMSLTLLFNILGPYLFVSLGLYKTNIVNLAHQRDMSLLLCSKMPKFRHTTISTWIVYATMYCVIVLLTIPHTKYHLKLQ